MNPCEECGEIPAYMHSKSGRMLCRQHIGKDGAGQLEDSKFFTKHELPKPDLEDFTFIETDKNMFSNTDKDSESGTGGEK